MYKMSCNYREKEMLPHVNQEITSFKEMIYVTSFSILMYREQFICIKHLFHANTSEVHRVVIYGA